MTAMTAQDVMTDSVVSVAPESPLIDVLRLFVEEDIHGAPVVDEAGRLVGVITTTDLLRAQEDEQDTARASIDRLREILEFSAPEWSGDLSDFGNRLAQRVVSEVMTKGCVSVPRAASVADVARCLRENRIHRVWVEDDGRLCGVVSTLDLMPVIENAAAD
jgi:CBS domain-containing protein